MEAFLDEFKHEDPVQLDKAFKAMLGNVSDFPTPADVRAQLKRAPDLIQHERLLAASTEILARTDKPADWKPMSQEEMREVWDAAVKKRFVSGMEKV